VHPTKKSLIFLFFPLVLPMIVGRNFKKVYIPRGEELRDFFFIFFFSCFFLFETPLTNKKQHITRKKKRSRVMADEQIADAVALAIELEEKGQIKVRFSLPSKISLT
jgi:hypothetical protein